MKSLRAGVVSEILLVSSLLILVAAPLNAQALPSGNLWREDDVIFEVVGQVRNTPFGGAGATSVQYGYLSFVKGLDRIFTSDDPTKQNEKTAMFTFFNDSTTLRATAHGSLRIIIREGTTTIYFNDQGHPSADLTVHNPDPFRQGIPVQTSTWRHQVITEPSPSGHFFVTFVNAITSVEPFRFEGEEVRLGKAGDKFRTSLVGDLDPAVPPQVSGKFAGYAVALASKK
jgi:hypothetical protein